MSFIQHHYHARPVSDQQTGNEEEAGSSADSLLVPADSAEIASIERSASKSSTLSGGKSFGTAMDALIPLAANVGQAAAEYGMAVVKFPDGVGWGDLCVRKRDGWNLLANFKEGKFNEMAAIKQAGLQPAAVANLALQGAAVFVGQAYMTQINDKLEGIESGISELQRVMERERDAKLKTAYDSLARLTLKYEEYGSSPEKLQIALQIIEDATKAAEEAWSYQLDAMRDFSKAISKGKKLKPEEIQKRLAELFAMESRAAVAFQLVIIAQQVGMRIDNDYTSRRIETDRQIISKMEEDYRIVRGGRPCEAIQAGC